MSAREVPVGSWWLVSAALATEPSAALKVVGGAGVVSGISGAALAGVGLSFAASPEPIGLIVFYPPGALGIAVGAPLAVGASIAQAHRVGADPTAGWVGLGLLAGGAAVVVGGAVSGTEEGGWLALAGGPAMGLGAVVAACAQGGTNQRAPVSTALLPDPARHGWRLVGVF